MPTPHFGNRPTILWSQCYDSYTHPSSCFQWFTQQWWVCKWRPLGQERYAYNRWQRTMYRKCTYCGQVLAWTLWQHSHHTTSEKGVLILTPSYFRSEPVYALLQLGSPISTPNFITTWSAVHKFCFRVKSGRGRQYWTVLLNIIGIYAVGFPDTPFS